MYNINPSSPKSDQQQISHPMSIHNRQNVDVQVMRIMNKMITQGKLLSIDLLTKFSQLARKMYEISQEHLYVDISQELLKRFKNWSIG